MMRLLGAACAAVGLVVTVSLGAAPAMATTTAPAAAGKASNVSTAEGQVSLLFEAEGTDASIDPDSVTMTLEGIELRPDAAPAGEGDATTLARTVMLVMDTSGSMDESGRLPAAQDAAEAFVNTLPDDVSIGLVAFGSQARTVVEPTDDRAALLDAISSLQARGNTAIFDAVTLAAEDLGTEGARSIFLLTDGDEKGSRATLEEATSTLEDQEIALDAVAFQSTAALTTLNALAEAGNGSVYSSEDAAQLTTEFENAAGRLSRQLLVTATIPDDAPTGTVEIQVAGDAEGQTVSATALGLLTAETTTPTIDASPRASAIANGPWMNSWFVWLAVGLFFVGLMGVLAFAFNAAVPTKQQGMSKQLSVYTLNGGKAKEQKRESTAFGDSNVAQSAVDFAGRLTAQRGLEEDLQRRLDAGAIPLKPAEWILIQAALLFLMPPFAWLLSGGSVVIVIVSVVAAAAGPFVFLSVKESRRRKKFVDSLPETLGLMSGSLSAGYSLPQSVDSVVRDGQDPVAGEFNRALVETRLGVPIEDALETIADRMRSKDWAWVVMAIRIQREVGGNLAELLLTVAGTLRERARIRRQIQTLSAEGRLSAWILGGLPIAFTLYLLLARPDYILTLTKEPLGWLMIVGGLILMTVGGLWMKKIVDVEV